MSEVSVIVLTYNADWNKLRMTLNSILLQRNIDYQIVIADDGSKTKWDNEIRGLFADFDFANYVIANLEENGGTVKNLYNGLKYADGAYIKPISPGDFFYDNTSLSGWVKYMTNNSSLFSFGDAVYYNDLISCDGTQNTNDSGKESDDSISVSSVHLDNSSLSANNPDTHNSSNSSAGDNIHVNVADDQFPESRSSVNTCAGDDIHVNVAVDQFPKSCSSVNPCAGDNVHVNVADELSPERRSSVNPCAGDDVHVNVAVDQFPERPSSVNPCAGDNVHVNIIESTAAPAHRDLFKKPQNRKKVFENYLLANDTILGASVMAEANLYKKYVEKIVGRLIYAEDYLARLLVFDGIEIDYYENPVIWYEYGTGSSSGINEKWVALLHKDFEESDHIILESDNCIDELSKKYISFLKESRGSGLMHKLKKCATFPGLVTARLDKSGGAVTPTDVDKQFLSEIV